MMPSAWPDGQSGVTCKKPANDPTDPVKNFL
jgi:hypothetical protein